MLIDLNTLKAIAHDVESVTSVNDNPEVFIEPTNHGFVYTIAGDNGTGAIRFSKPLTTLQAFAESFHPSFGIKHDGSLDDPNSPLYS